MDAPADLKQWRKELRRQLIDRRMACGPAERSAWSKAINGHLIAGFGRLAGLVVGFCWPYKGEADPRPFIQELRRQGSRVALPAVVVKARPLEFREWWPHAPMAAGALGIPVPAGTPILAPDAVLVPPVGIDGGGWRLGYGGGYFDRTLASLSPHPIKICIAYEMARIATIHPQPHDIPMDFVVSEAGIHVVEAGTLRLIDAAACGRRVVALIAERGLPRRQGSASS
ncbi:MAG: 5-formyltetrahydrofolate cyclo-ligase [Verrucomicrobia bacterium]|nr:5-formyltetrahydrofolate cyclo-ligase [Verrucomicrobiota bacterium]